MVKKLSLIAAIFVAVGMVSCQKVQTPQTPESVALYTHSDPKAKASASGSIGVTICATSEWTATPTVDWITVTPESGGRGINEVVLTYEQNTSGAQRQGGVVFASKGNSETYVLTQDK